MKKIYLWMLALFLCWQTNAQVNAYTFTSNVATYVPLTTGAVAASGGAIDEEEIVVTLPSPFKFNNQWYDSVAFSANGRLYLGDFESEGPTGVIVAMGFNLVASAATAEMRCDFIGDEMVFQWKDFKRKINNNNERFNFQARLNLANNTVKMVYGDFTDVSTTTTYGNYPSVGLRGSDSEDFFLRRLTATVPSSDPSWNNTTYANSSDQNLRLTSSDPACIPDSGLTYLWVPPTNVINLAISSFPLEQNSYCPVTGVPLKVTIKNVTAYPLDLALHPATVTVIISDASSHTFTQVVNTGTLAPDEELEVVLSNGTDFTAAGHHAIQATVTIEGDIATNNNEVNTSLTIRPILPTPFEESFGMTQNPDNWLLYDWGIGPEHGKTTNGLYKRFNVIGSSFQLPTVGTVGASDFLEFDFRALNTSGYPAFPVSTYWGRLTISVSTDCGRTFTDIAEISPDNFNATTDWTRKSYPLAAFAGQNVMILISNRWIVGDYFLDFDNFSIKSSGTPPPTLCAAASNPANDAQDIMTGDVTLSWTPASGGSAATSYDVYYGTSSSNPVLIGNTTQTSMVVQANTPNTSYFWKVVAQSAEGGSAADCPTWAFTTCEGTWWYQDLDHDTYGNPAVSFLGCQQPLNYVANSDDCDDSNATLFQTFDFYADNDGDGFGAGERVPACAVDANTPPSGYALHDTDCDDNDATMYESFPFYIDADHDGFGTGTTVLACAVNAATPPSGYSANNTDCDDNNASKNRTFPFYADADGDGYGAGEVVMICNPNGTAPPPGYSVHATDCDDTNAAMHQTYSFYVDADGDGYGSGSLVLICAANANTPPAGYVSNNTDCNDNDAAVYRSAAVYVDADNDTYTAGVVMICYGDNLPAGYRNRQNGFDCDDNDALVYRSVALYEDADGDGYSTGGGTNYCLGAEIPAGYSTTSIGIDCDDNNAAVYLTVSVYADADQDGYTVGGQANMCIGATIPAGYATTSLGTDCDDNNAAVYRTVSVYADADQDGYTVGSQISICAGATIPAGYTTTSSGTDCDDNSAAINPGAVEIPNDGIDNNCNGLTDETAGITTQLLPSACGSTLATINSLIGINTSYAGQSATTAYRIRLTNGAQVQTIVKNVPHFSLMQFASYEYGTAYDVAIELQQNGVWLGYYGNSCTISSPAITAVGGSAAVTPAQCGAQLPSINTLIASTSLPGVTGYRFRVTNLTDPNGPNAVQQIDRNLNWFSLQMLQRYNYGTTYKIEVAVKTTGDFGPFGQPCEVHSQAVPTLTNCGATLAKNTTPISAASASGATQYRFMVKRVSDGASVTIDRNTNFFTLNSVPGILADGASYWVEVAVMTAGSWSPFGNACTITAPGGSAVITADAVQQIAVVAHPNPFTNDFNLSVRADSSEKAVVKVYDLWGRLLESTVVDMGQAGEVKLGSQFPAGTYQVSVSLGAGTKTLQVIKR